MGVEHEGVGMLEKLKAALGQAPWDRGLRLVYADCLEESGFTDEAEEQRRRASKRRCRPPRGRLAGARDAYRKTGNSALYRKLRDLQFNISELRYLRRERGRPGPAHTSWKESRKHRWRAV
jgi:uncharacterized protein (TIGR02996 family)